MVYYTASLLEYMSVPLTQKQEFKGPFSSSFIPLLFQPRTCHKYYGPPLFAEFFLPEE